MSVCETVITQSDALADLVLRWDAQRRGPGLSLITAKLRERMIAEAELTQTVNAGARAVLRAAAQGLAGKPNPAPPVPANDFEPEPHRA